MAVKAEKATALDYQVILSPVVTEKSSLVGNGGRTSVFLVDPRSTKTEIKAAVEAAFKVSVVGVRTVNLMGKPKRSGNTLGRRAAKKKAYITVKEGQKIDVVEGL